MFLLLGDMLLSITKAKTLVEHFKSFLVTHQEHKDILQFFFFSPFLHASFIVMCIKLAWYMPAALMLRSMNFDTACDWNVFDVNFDLFSNMNGVSILLLMYFKFWPCWQWDGESTELRKTLNIGLWLKLGVGDGRFFFY